MKVFDDCKFYFFTPFDSLSGFFIGSSALGSGFYLSALDAFL
jgi:hypothetical protein